MTAVLVTVGASFVFVTLMVRDFVAVAPASSVARITTALSPTNSFVGTPLKVLLTVSKVSHAGFVGVDRVMLSPTSISETEKL